jgi:hypothetical protein
MEVINSVVGPRTKRNTCLPYTFEARVDILAGHGHQPVFNHYYSSTICGLISHLDSLGFFPRDVELFGAFRGRQTGMAMQLFTTQEGRWVQRPELCGVLEKHFKISREECYRGHAQEGPCCFEDRDRECFGPTS